MIKNNILDGNESSLFISEKQASSLLQISEPTLKRIRYSGKIECYRVGGRVFYSQKMLDDFIDHCKEGGKVDG